MKTIMRTTAIKMSIFLLITITLISCAETKYDEAVMLTESVESVDNYNTSLQNEEATVVNGKEFIQSPSNLKIIKTATTRYKVEDVMKATVAIKKMAALHGAYVSELKYTNSLYEKQNKLTLKVPNTYFAEMMDTIASTATFIEFENITTQDVTEEYVDVKTRLETKLEVKQRYESILRNKAKTVEEVLLAEEKLSRLQEEIEAAQGRLTYLSERVAYSTIHIELFETVSYQEEPESFTKTFAAKAGNGFHFGWEMVEVAILALIHMWPLFLIGVILFILFKYFRSKTK